MFYCLVCADLMLRHFISNIFFKNIVRIFFVPREIFFKKQNCETQTLKFSNLKQIKTNKPKTNTKNTKIKTKSNEAFIVKKAAL